MKQIKQMQEMLYNTKRHLAEQYVREKMGREPVLEGDALGYRDEDGNIKTFTKEEGKEIEKYAQSKLKEMLRGKI